MLPSEEEEFLDTRLVTINGHHLPHSHSSDSGSNRTLSMSGRTEPYLHIPPPPPTEQPHSGPETVNTKWPRGADSLASSWAFTLSLHSLLYLPQAVIRHGGVVFLLMYLSLVVILGLPLLILEMFLGQYSTLPVGRLYRHLCPLLSGLGVSLCLTAGLRTITDLGMAMWSSHGLVTIINDQSVTVHHNTNYSITSLEDIRDIIPYNVAALAALALLAYILMAASVKSIGKVSLLVVPLVYGLLITLVIRTCMEPAGPPGFVRLMTPDWSVLSRATAWLEAVAHVIFSLQLGTGVISSYAGYNKYSHSILRDCWVITAGHIIFSLLSVLLLLSLTGVADVKNIISLPESVAEAGAELSNSSVFGDSVGLSNIVLVLETFSSVNYGWLWAALFSILIIMVCITNIFGYVEMISNSISYQRPALVRFKPLVSLVVIFSAALVSVCLSTEGGAHVFQVLQTYIADWPLLLFTLLTVTAAVHCHLMSAIINNISIISRRKLSNFSASHLSVILTTVLPILTSASLGWTLYVLSIKSLESAALPSDWGLPLVWTFSAVPLLPLLAGLLWYLTLGARGNLWIKQLRGIVKPTSTWHRNHQMHNFGGDQTKVQSLAQT